MKIGSAAIDLEERRTRVGIALANYTAVRVAAKKRIRKDFCARAFLTIRDADDVLKPIARTISPAMKTARRQALRAFRTRCT